jgi:hypothetical protein
MSLAEMQRFLSHSLHPEPSDEQLERLARRVSLKWASRSPALNIGVEALEGFARSGTALAPDIMTRLAQDLFGSSSVKFDAARNLLVRTTPEARPLGIRPPSVNEMKLELPKFTGGPAPPRPHSAALPGAKQSRRPGWAH